MLPQAKRLQKLADWLQFYADSGYHLTPLNGKVPISGNWPAVKYEPFPQESDFPYGNFGVVLQNDDLVIDIDPRNFKENMNSLTLLETAISTPLESTTLSVRTGSGGKHLYFKNPRKVALKYKLPAFPGIEFKSGTGHQVVGAGSLHPDTKGQYEIVFGFSAVDAPENLLKLLEQPELFDEPPLKGCSDDPQTVERYVNYLKITSGAVEGHQGDRTTFTAAATGHDFGLTEGKCYELLELHYNPKCTPPWSPDDLQKKVKNAYAYATAALGVRSPLNKFEDIKPDEAPLRWDFNDNGYLRTGSLRNTVNFFRDPQRDLYGVLALNEFSGDIVFKTPAPWHKPNEKYFIWNDAQALECKHHMATHFQFEPATNIIHEAAVVTARIFKFHPVRNYLENLKWDNFKRIHTWLQNYMGVEDNLYTRTIGMKILVAAVARVYDPGCMFQYLPVFEGAQGTGKSRSLAVLAEPWFSDQMIDVRNRDTVDAMRGKWIIEVSEMETHYRSETQAMKAFISRSTDRCRLAYARTADDFHRQCIFIGTINPESDTDLGYLKDTTGNRRYWPIKTGVILLDQLKKVRDQLWAEALIFYKQGIPIYLEDAMINKIATEEQKKRVGRDPWTDKIKDWVNGHELYRHRTVIRGEEIFTDCLGGRIERFDRRAMIRISQVMGDLDWEKGVYYTTVDRASVRGYKRPTLIN